MNYILFVKDECPYCVDAEDLLTSKDLDFKKVVFSEEQQQTLTDIKSAYDWPTVPMVFHRTGRDVKFIGGFSDLTEYLSDE